ncbi:MAG TPA: hypothetical protein VFQ15_07320 [Jiangellaceae bacterium]|nr:hypothetical protein [Jiangellaceae bacterium]
MRLLGRLAVATSVSAVAGLGLVVAGATTAHAQANTCTGNNVIDQAPYSCTETRDISGITFTINVNIDATGRAVVDFTMSPAQQADIPIAVHSYTDISADPREFINGVIPAGQTTAQIVVPRIECGQFDIKAVETTPGDSAGNIAGPVVTWGVVCQVPTTTTTVAPTSPTSVSPSSVTPTIPPTGASRLVEAWRWAVPLLGLAAIMIVVARRRPAAG